MTGGTLVVPVTERRMRPYQYRGVDCVEWVDVLVYLRQPRNGAYFASPPPTLTLRVQVTLECGYPRRQQGLVIRKFIVMAVEGLPGAMPSGQPMDSLRKAIRDVLVAHYQPLVRPRNTSWVPLEAFDP